MATRTAAIVGAVVGVGSALVALVGAAVLIVFGSDSALSTGPQHVNSSTAALVAPVGDVQGIDGVGAAPGRPVLRLAVDNPRQDVFIGVGPTRAVEKYLAGVDVDRVDDLDVNPFRLDLEHRHGSVRPAAPADQPFWAAESAGSAASLDWKVRDGDYRIVVMNADGSPGVAATGRFTVVVPHLHGYALAAVSVGLAGIAVGAVSVGLGVRRSRRPHSGPADHPSVPTTVG